MNKVWGFFSEQKHRGTILLLESDKESNFNPEMKTDI